LIIWLPNIASDISPADILSLRNPSLGTQEIYSSSKHVYIAHRQAKTHTHTHTHTLSLFLSLSLSLGPGVPLHTCLALWITVIDQDPPQSLMSDTLSVYTDPRPVLSLMPLRTPH